MLSFKKLYGQIKVEPQSQEICSSGVRAFKSKNTVPAVKNGGGSIMLWGSSATSGNGILDKVDGIMKRKNGL